MAMWLPLALKLDQPVQVPEIGTVPLWVVVLLGGLLILAIVEEVQSAFRPTALAFPYYVDQDGLRALAHSLKVAVPTTREVTRSRRMSAQFRGVGGVLGREYVEKHDVPVDLNRFAEKLRKKAPQGTLFEGGSAPLAGLGEFELLRVASENRLIMVTGALRSVPAGGPEGHRTFTTVLAGKHVAFRLIDEDAFTDFGRARLQEGPVFHGQAIGHSATWDTESSVLWCFAYAVWGKTK